MKNLFLPLFCLILTNCNKSGVAQNEIKADKAFISNKEPSLPVSAVASPPPSPMEMEKGTSTSASSNTSGIDIISRKLIKNGEMSIQVGDIQKAQNKVNEILKKNNAYIQNEKFSNTDMDENLDLTIRVPHKDFDTLINSFSDGIGSILTKNISSNDVTEEYTDVSIKLTNKKIYIEKYRDMLKKAATTKDMLEIQENIRELEDEIDVAEGRLRFIDDRVNYSTLNLSLFKEKVRSSTTSKIGFGSRFADSITEGWNIFIGFFLGLISFWPFLLLLPVIISLWRKWKLRRKK